MGFGAGDGSRTRDIEPAGFGLESQVPNRRYSTNPVDKRLEACRDREDTIDGHCFGDAHRRAALVAATKTKLANIFGLDCGSRTPTTAASIAATTASVT